MSLYTIIKSLQEALGSNAKLAILEANKDNKLLREYLKATYDPSMNYYQSRLPTLAQVGTSVVSTATVKYIIHHIAGRKITGKAATQWLRDVAEHCNREGQTLLEMLIKRSIGAGVSHALILKVWPDLYFIPPYQRCSLMDDNIKAKFSKLPIMYVQPKLDGSFMYLIKEAGKPPQAMTRAGSIYPQWFADRLAEGLPDGSVLMGEVEVWKEYGRGISGLRSRQVGNGILNSVLKGEAEEEFVDSSFTLTAWDMITPEEFKAGESTRSYVLRLSALSTQIYDELTPNIGVIRNESVFTVAEAYDIYSKLTAQGLEGAVLKNPASLWKDGTSKDMIKLKIAFEAEYKIVGMLEGTGKYVGMMGSLLIESEDGKIACAVGTGFTDAMRKAYWQQKEYITGKICCVIANDVLTSRDSVTYSLFLPVFSDVRFDKTVADDFEQVMKQLNAAKGM